MMELSGMSDPTPTVDVPSTPPIRFRRTRIAVSVFFGLLTVVLVALWIRSYSFNENLSFRTGSTGTGAQRMVGMGSNWGFAFNFSTTTVEKGTWLYSSQPAWERRILLFEWDGNNLSLKIHY